MIHGQDEFVPRIVREPDLPSDARESAHVIADEVIAYYDKGILGPEIQRGSINGAQLALLAQAVKRYVPPGLPPAAAHPVADAADCTMPVALPPTPNFGTSGVIGMIEPETSDGIVEASQDDARTSVAQMDHTSMHRSHDGQAFVVKLGEAQAVPIPHLATITRR